ncbi:MAG: hypothetical protein IT372_05825 [Polyangiaceae bacterium]|nr:hypothetical protein [Polyangiaceae bacterium]
MPATVHLIANASVHRGIPFVITVELRGAPPGQSVTMVVEQKRGAIPFWPTQHSAALVNDGGFAAASFRFALSGPGEAVLIATAYDRASTCFEPDAAVIHVD